MRAGASGPLILITNRAGWHIKQEKMKAIEKKMIQALESGVNFKLSNTEVKHNTKGAFVWLYDTIIYAKVNGVFYFSDGGYNTVTTSSRLRSLGAEYSTNERKNKAALHSQKDMQNLWLYGRVS